MAKKSAIDLYQSKASIPSMRRTAPQIHPQIARMHQSTGMEKVGEAMMDVAQQMHQVNVTRQVTNAMAEYKMKAADFMARMQNADPSKVNFDEEYKKFMAEQGGLASGVSRDAANIISNKLTEYGASTYSQLKRTEISNQRGMALVEAPEVLEGLVNDCAKDPSRCAEAKQEWNSYLQGIAPALRPHEAAKLKNAWDDAERGAIESYQENAVMAQVNAGNTKAAKQMLDASALDEKKKFSLNNAIGAKNNKQEYQSTLRRNMQKEEDAGVILDTIGTGGVPHIENTDRETQDYIDMINMRETHDGSNIVMDPPASYYDLKDKLDDLKPVTDRDLLKTYAEGASKDMVNELRAQQQENAKLMEHRDAYKNGFKFIKSNFNAVEDIIESKYEYGDNEITETILREMDELEAHYIDTLKKDLINGESYEAIAKGLEKKFEYTRKNIVESYWQGGGVKWFKPKITELHSKLQFADKKYSAQTAEYMRAQGMLNLMQSEGKHRDLIESMVKADMFTADIPEPNAPVAPPKKEREDFGAAPSGREKGDGFWGKIPIHDKEGNKTGVATEYSISTSDVIEGQEVEIPTLVPTLEDAEFVELVENVIPNRLPIPDSIAQKAIEHARMRIKEGKSPFWNPKDDVKK